MKSNAAPSRRVLHVLPALGMGGAIRVVSDLIVGLHELGGYEQRLCVLQGEGGRFAAYALPEATIHLGFSGAWRNPFETRRTIRRLKHVIADLQPDVLHTHLWTADVIGAAAAAKTQTRHVAHLHDTRTWLASRRVRHAIRRTMTRGRLMRSRAECIAVSEAVKTYFCQHIGYPASRVTVVHNGTDVLRFDLSDSPRTYLTNGRPAIVGTAGRFDSEKGHEYLIRAVAAVRGRGCNVQLHIAGDGMLRPRYEELIREFGLADAVQMLGAVSDMARFYRDIDIFVLPSLAAEGLPMTILEAMALATPTVATAVAGTPEIIRDGNEGLLVPPRDVDQLARAIERLASDPALREKLGTRSRERVAGGFTVHHMAAGVAAVHERVSGAKQA